jgi:hypothetical protein
MMAKAPAKAAPAQPDLRLQDPFIVATPSGILGTFRLVTES